MIKHKSVVTENYDKTGVKPYSKELKRDSLETLGENRCKTVTSVKFEGSKVKVREY